MNTQSKHTSAPWEVLKEAFPPDEVETNRFGIVKRPGVDVFFIRSDDAMVAYLTGSHQEVNAQRIVSCVNACEGFGNEALNGGVLAEMLGALKNLVDQAQEKYPHFESPRGQDNIKNALSVIAKAQEGRA